MKYLITLISIITLLSGNASAMKLDKFNYNHTEIYSVNFDPHEFDMSIARALDGGIGKEDVLSIAKRNGAVAAINGSFWESGGKANGIPAFLLKVREQIFVEKHEYPIVYFSSSGDVTFTKIHTAPYIMIGKKKVACAINMPQITAPVTVYTRTYANSTLTNPHTHEVTIINDKVTKVSSEGNSKIPENGFVISFNKNAISMHVGDSIKLETTIPINADYIMSGSNMLLANGELDSYLSDPKHANSFRDMQHARSAICKMKNGNVALITTDYIYENDIKTMTTKQTWEFLQPYGYSREDVMKMTINDFMAIYHKITSEQKSAKGLTLGDFAIALKNHGCIDALNLDGGSSSTLIYKDKVIAGKRPKLQEDSDAIIVKVKK